MEKSVKGSMEIALCIKCRMVIKLGNIVVHYKTALFIMYFNVSYKQPGGPERRRVEIVILYIVILYILYTDFNCF
jgi:hypothetical protein